MPSKLVIASTRIVPLSAGRVSARPPTGGAVISVGLGRELNVAAGKTAGMLRCARRSHGVGAGSP